MLGPADAADFRRRTTTSPQTAISKVTIFPTASEASMWPATTSLTCRRHARKATARTAKAGFVRDSTTKFWPTGTGLMIAALVHAACVFDKPDWSRSRERAFEFIRNQHDPRRTARSFLARRQACVSRRSRPTMPRWIAPRLRSVEATGDNAYLAQAIAGKPRSTRTTPMPTMAAIT